MNKLLVINCCMRSESRTERILKAAFEKYVRLFNKFS